RPNPMMSSLLSLGIKMAEEGETIQTLEGGLLPAPRMTVRAFLQQAGTVPSSSLPEGANPPAVGQEEPKPDRRV
ncbi:MAG: hypothetical protein ABI682_15765, partial [Acidobacteriota bacterium]